MLIAGGGRGGAKLLMDGVAPLVLLHELVVAPPGGPTRAYTLPLALDGDARSGMFIECTYPNKLDDPILLLALHVIVTLPSDWLRACGLPGAPGNMGGSGALKKFMFGFLGFATSRCPVHTAFPKREEATQVYGPVSSSCRSVMMILLGTDMFKREDEVTGTPRTLRIITSLYLLERSLFKATLHVMMENNGVKITLYVDPKSAFFNAINVTMEMKNHQNNVEISIEKCMLHNFSLTVQSRRRNKLKEAVENIRNNKSPGVDEIPSELWKADIEKALDLILSLIKDIWVQEVLPTEWNNGIIIKISKKGDRKNCCNWRGVTLLCSINQILASVIHQRIYKKVEEQLRNEQV
nr:unnamed protein product [Callosobruchus analis]